LHVTGVQTCALPISHPLEGVRINEVLARTSSPVLDFMELYNHRPAPVDLSGCVLTDDALEAKFRIPEGTILQPGGFIAWDETQLGFGLSGDGEAVYLIDAAGEVVIDAVRFGPQMAGVASGRTPDGAD